MLRVLENMVLRKICGKMEEATGLGKIA